MKRRHFNRLAALVLALALLVAVVPAGAYARTRTVTESRGHDAIHRKYWSENLKEADANRKVLRGAVKYVKRGTTKLVMKRGYGIFRFKAPKSKTYTFTISDVRSKKGTWALLFPLTYEEAYVRYRGWNLSLSNGLAYQVSGRRFQYDGLNFDAGVGRTFSKKSFKVKLRKGETFDFDLSVQGNKRSTAKLKIK